MSDTPTERCTRCGAEHLISAFCACATPEERAAWAWHMTPPDQRGLIGAGPERPVRAAVTVTVDRMEYRRRRRECVGTDRLGGGMQIGWCARHVLREMLREQGVDPDARGEVILWWPPAMMPEEV